MKKWIVCMLLSLMAMSGFGKGKKEFTVLQWNIWQEGTVVEGGYDAIVNEIVRLKPDFVTFSEVRNYHNTRFCDRITQSLAQHGLTYYSHYSDDSGLMSRYPITEFTTVSPLKDDHGSVYRAVTSIHGKEVALYTAHLDYLDDAYYNVRGYDGSTWKKIPVPESIAEVLTRNDRSQRDDEIRAFIRAAQKDVEAGRMVFLGGDFNEPSHLDWTRETKDLYDHNGMIVPWTVPLLLDNAGFMDAYRVRYPNVLDYPGFTFPSDNPDVNIKNLTWAPDADERDRIDFVFYHPFEGLKVKDAVIFGPTKSIVKSQRVEETGKDRFIKPLGVWPTDHKGVLVTFTLK